MNQEYLWSKKGNDPDVERLEGLLGEFRFDGDAAPKQIIPVAKASKRRFVLGLSFAATAAALLVVVIWVTRTPVTPVAKTEQNTASRQTTAVLRNDALAEGSRTDSAEAEQVFLTTPTARPTRSKDKRTARPPKAEKAKLTKEEKYAYDRLMFALGLAGSKFRMVQDTIDRKGDAELRPIRNEK